MVRGARRSPILKSIYEEPAPKKIIAQLNANLHNRFDIEVIDATSGKVKQKAYAENVICAGLWTRLFAPNTYFNHIFFGTGSGTPSSEDTALFTHLGYKSVTDSLYSGYSIDYDNCKMQLQKSCQLSETEYVGSTLTEVGLGWGTASTNLVTHAMLKDMNGNQISIAKTSTDIINIYATVFLHWSATGHDSGYINVHPVIGNDFFTWALGAGSSPAITDLLCTHGGVYNAYSKAKDTLSYDAYFLAATAPTYSSAAKTLTSPTKRLAVGAANMNGIGTICLGVHSTTLGTHDPFISFAVGGSWYSGTDIVAESIGTGDGSAKDFATDFPFVKSGAKIYVDGVEQTSGITVDVDTPLTCFTNMGVYFKLIKASVPSLGSYMRGVPSPTWPIYSTTGFQGIYYNPLWSLGIASFTAQYCSVQVSNDLTNWTTVTSPISGDYRYYKYWKLTATGSDVYAGLKTLTAVSQPTTNIHFTTAPVSGAVITADYTTKTIAKDANHVFDFSAVITFGEYTA